MPVRPVPPSPPRRPWASAGPTLAVLLFAGCSATPAPTPSSTTPTATAPSPSTSSPASASEVATAVDALLTRREAALVAGDTRAFTATVAEPASDAGRAQLASSSAARALRVARLTHDVVAPVDDPSDVEVTLRYRIAGTDRADRTARVRYAVVRVGGTWRVAEETAVEAAPPWLAMPGMRVVRTSRAVVVGTAPDTALEAASRTVERALPRLAKDWSDTPRRVLVLVPATVAEAAALGGGTAGGVGRVAASTDGPLGADGRATGDRVVLDPQARERLTPAGRDVVLTHELAHVAVRASVPGSAPTWLSEGYADHVGYARADVPDAALLAPLTAAVRAGTAPTALPDTASLDPAVGDIEVGYLAAWQAAELVADRYGEATLRRLVRRCSVLGPQEAAERACDATMPAVLGTDRAGLTRAWRQRLDALAR
ncbi:hypothetical protein [Phycicoccus avicenniae]|uniref:hypothetical protein n=1 Tax=Phycicoccus avicenniae TaxID=2828860 RepID=UPI003D295948